MKLDIDFVLESLQYRIGSQPIDLSNPIHIYELKSVLRDLGYSKPFITELISNIITEENPYAITKNTGKKQYYSSEEAKDNAVDSGKSEEPSSKDDSDKDKSDTSDDGEEDIKLPGERIAGEFLFKDDDIDKVKSDD